MLLAKETEQIIKACECSLLQAKFNCFSCMVYNMDVIFRWAIPVVYRILVINKSQTQLGQYCFFLFDYMFRPFMIRSSSGSSFYVEETVPFIQCQSKSNTTRSVLLLFIRLHVSAFHD